MQLLLQLATLTRLQPRQATGEDLRVVTCVIAVYGSIITQPISGMVPTVRGSRYVEQVLNFGQSFSSLTADY
jgi:hypothetical protein